MRGPDFLTPGEARLAALLFLLSVLGFAVRGLDSLDPRIRDWLETAGTSAEVPENDPRGGRVQIHPETVAGPTVPFPAPARVRTGTESPGPGTAGRVNPNTADAAGLSALPGIGPSLAARILADRRARGPYRRPEDLLRVRGIGPATVDRFRERLDFGRP